ncbi:MAG: hypothetical protein UZ10_BCD003002515 [Bacteroidetes bacterium OLB10]|nr:MAG: hypothetical protein UZ10_BCD003002515 [Bacteroidetes bacterium OLB10]
MRSFYYNFQYYKILPQKYIKFFNFGQFCPNLFDCSTKYDINHFENLVI